MFLFLPIALAYVLSPYPIFKNPKIFSLCPFIHPNLRLASYEVAASEINYIQFSSINSSGSICNKNIPEYGKTQIHLLSNFFTEITIANSIMNLHNTLYNVLLHEMIHSL